MRAAKKKALHSCIGHLERFAGCGLFRYWPGRFESSLAPLPSNPPRSAVELNRTFSLAVLQASPPSATPLLLQSFTSLHTSTTSSHLFSPHHYSKALLSPLVHDQPIQSYLHLS